MLKKKKKVRRAQIETIGGKVIGQDRLSSCKRKSEGTAAGL